MRSREERPGSPPRGMELEDDASRSAPTGPWQSICASGREMQLDAVIRRGCGHVKAGPRHRSLKQQRGRLFEGWLNRRRPLGTLVLFGPTRSDDDLAVV